MQLKQGRGGRLERKWTLKVEMDRKYCGGGGASNEPGMHPES